MSRPTPELLDELSYLFHLEASNVGGDPHAWPPPPPLEAEQRRERERLFTCAAGLRYRAVLAAAERGAAYAAWVSAYVAERGAGVFGRCREASEAMNREFPELRVARGHVLDARWGKRSHWWCVAPGGAIVDPTASQFPLLLDYEEWAPGDRVHVGKCMDCGEEIWEAVESLEGVVKRDFCSEACERRTLAYLGGGEP